MVKAVTDQAYGQRLLNLICQFKQQGALSKVKNVATS